MMGEQLKSWRNDVHSKGFELTTTSEIVGSHVAFRLGNFYLFVLAILCCPELIFHVSPPGDEEGYVLFTVHSSAPTEHGRPKKCYIVRCQEPRGTQLLCIQLLQTKRMEDPDDLKISGKGNWATVEHRLRKSVPCASYIPRDDVTSAGAAPGSWQTNIVDACYAAVPTELVPWVAQGGFKGRKVAYQTQLGWGVVDVLTKHASRSMAQLEMYVARDAYGNETEIQLLHERHLPLNSFRTDVKAANNAKDKSWILLEGPVHLNSVGIAGQEGSADRESAGSHLSRAAAEEEETITPVQLRHRFSEEGAEENQGRSATQRSSRKSRYESYTAAIRGDERDEGENEEAPGGQAGEREDAQEGGEGGEDGPDEKGPAQATNKEERAVGGSERSGMQARSTRSTRGSENVERWKRSTTRSMQISVNGKGKGKTVAEKPVKKGRSASDQEDEQEDGEEPAMCGIEDAERQALSRSARGSENVVSSEEASSYRQLRSASSPPSNSPPIRSKDGAAKKGKGRQGSEKAVKQGTAASKVAAEQEGGKGEEGGPDLDAAVQVTTEEEPAMRVTEDSGMQAREMRSTRSSAKVSSNEEASSHRQMRATTSPPSSTSPSMSSSEGVQRSAAKQERQGSKQGSKKGTAASKETKFLRPDACMVRRRSESMVPETPEKDEAMGGCGWGPEKGRGVAIPPAVCMEASPEREGWSQASMVPDSEASMVPDSVSPGEDRPSDANMVPDLEPHTPSRIPGTVCLSACVRAMPETDIAYWTTRCLRGGPDRATTAVAEWSWSR
eukprot:2500211-Rhodomonas_salina.1